jgi:hypothetical protein
MHARPGMRGVTPCRVPHPTVLYRAVLYRTAAGSRGAAGAARAIKPPAAAASTSYLPGRSLAPLTLPTRDPRPGLRSRTCANRRTAWPSE